MGGDRRRQAHAAGRQGHPPDGGLDDADQIGLWGGIVKVLGNHQVSLADLWPLVCFAALSAYIQVPVMTLACKGIRLAQLLPNLAVLRGVRNR